MVLHKLDTFRKSILFFWVCFVLFILFIHLETESHNIALEGLKLTDISMTLPPEY